MTIEEFNEKYKNNLEDTFYGLSINIPSVIKFLDKIFEDLVKIPDFKYSQIKMKFGSARFYSTLCSELNFIIESKINQLADIYIS
jgi:hypothetical protein